MKKICFINALQPMVLKGTKQQTRRIISKENYINGDNVYVQTTDGGGVAHFTTRGVSCSFAEIISRYKVGETVAIAQPYKDILDLLPEPYRRASDGWIDIDILTSIGHRNKLYVNTVT